MSICIIYEQFQGSIPASLTASSVGQTEVGMHRISGWPDIRPDNPAFFDIRYPAG
jgi:hypothetical protein